MAAVLASKMVIAMAPVLMMRRTQSHIRWNFVHTIVYQPTLQSEISRVGRDWTVSGVLSTKKPDNETRV